MLGSVAAIAVVVIGGFFALRTITINEARRDTRERVEAEGHLVEAAALRDGVLRGDPRALARLDDVVLGQVLAGSIVRVKVWSQNGTILYSDEPSLIGRRFALGAEERQLLRTGGSEAELSDLSRPENRLERSAGKLLEAYTPIRTPNGTPVLFEIYQRFGSVNASGARLLRALAPPLLAGLLVLLLFQVPLAWSMARRLQRGYREREDLLEDAVEASTQERRRIAADLHDGIVQDLAGVAFGLAPLAGGGGPARRRRGGGRAARGDRAAAPGRARPAHAARRDPSPESRVDRARGRARATCSARSRPPASPRSCRSTRRAPARATRSCTASRVRRCATCRRTPARNACDVELTRAQPGSHASRRERRRARIRAQPSASGAKPRVTSGCRCCQGLVERAGGRLTVAFGARARNDRRAGGARRMIRVLIADDHGVIRDGLGRLIGALPDMDVVGLAADGAEAVELCRTAEPDVVLMDLEMPGVDGIEATRRILVDRPATAVLVLTSFSDRPRILGALEAGACGYLLKDVAAEQVAEGIRAAARGESPLDPRAARTVLAARTRAGSRGRPLATRARGARAARRGTAEQADRAPARDQREDGEVASDERLPCDRGDRSNTGGAVGRAQRVPRPGHPVSATKVGLRPGPGVPHDCEPHR